MQYSYDFEQNVEYKENKVDGLIEQRLNFLKETLVDILGDIHKRASIFQKNLGDIRKKELHLDNLIIAINHQANNVIGSERLSVEDNLIDLLKEKMSHEVSYWQDVVKLKSTLREVLESYYLTSAMFKNGLPNQRK